MDEAFHMDGLGAACDDVNVYDADTVNQGYANSKLMDDMCAMYLDGDDTIDVNGTPQTNPLHAYGYAHPHDHKIILTHSMGGMYTSKNFATQNCQRILPTSVVAAAASAGYSNMVPGLSLTGTTMETTYVQSQPPMDGSNAAKFNVQTCKIFPKLISDQSINTAFNFLKMVCYPLAVLLKPFLWLYEWIFGTSWRDWLLAKLEDAVNVVGGGVLANSCYEVTASSTTTKKLWGIFKYTKHHVAEWDGRLAFYSIWRRDPVYTGAGHQTQDKYFANERMCGTSPWGTGGGSGVNFCAIQELPNLQFSWRDICLLYMVKPCKCSWRGCDWCKSSWCLITWPKTPYNDGAVSVSSCQTYGEETHFTYMPLNHDDGTMRLVDNPSRKDQQPMLFFKD